MWRLLLSLTLLASTGRAATFDPTKAPALLTTDDQKVAWAFREACKGQGNTVDLSMKNWVFTKPIETPSLPYLCLHIIGNGYWKNWEYTQKGYWLTLHNLKHGSIKNLRGVSADSGILLTSDGSSSGNRFEDVRVQAVRTAFRYEAPSGVDISANTWDSCEAMGAEVGFQLLGSNNLDGFFQNCRADGCGIGFDLRKGGSNYQFWGGGGSNCSEFFVGAGGYQGETHFQSIEVCGTAFRLGGDDCDGFGQDATAFLGALDVRSTPVAAVVNKAGSTTIDFKKCSGTIRIENRSDLTAELVLQGAARKAVVNKSGKWTVVGQQQAVID